MPQEKQYVARHELQLVYGRALSEGHAWWERQRLKPEALEPKVVYQVYRLKVLELAEAK